MRAASFLHRSPETHQFDRLDWKGHSPLCRVPREAALSVADRSGAGDDWGAAEVGLPKAHRRPVREGVDHAAK